MTGELQRALDPVAEALDALRVRYRIGGSVASSAQGVARSTLDVDLVADLESSQVEPFVEYLSADYYVDRESIRDAVRHRRSFNVIHLATMIKIDVFVLGDRPYDRASFERVAAQPIGGDAERAYPMSTPEDVVLRKLEWFELGDRVSERQWGDVLGVLRVQWDGLDVAYMRQWAERLGIGALLESALVEAAGGA